MHSCSKRFCNCIDDDGSKSNEIFWDDSHFSLFDNHNILFLVKNFGDRFDFDMMVNSFTFLLTLVCFVIPNFCLDCFLEVFSSPGCLNFYLSHTFRFWLSGLFDFFLFGKIVIALLMVDENNHHNFLVFMASPTPLWCVQSKARAWNFYWKVYGMISLNLNAYPN